MKKVLIIIAVIAAIAAAWYCGKYCCHKNVPSTEDTDKLGKDHKELFLFSNDFISNDTDYYVAFEDDTLTQILPNLSVYVELNPNKYSKTATNTIKFWAVKKGAPKPENTSTPSFSYPNIIDINELKGAKSKNIIQVVTKSGGAIKYVINPPTNPVGPAPSPPA